MRGHGIGKNTGATLFVLVPLLFGSSSWCYSQSLRIIPQKTITIADLARAKTPKFGAISVNTQKEIYITDIALNRILRLDANGALLRETGGFGWEVEQFDRPLDIWAENALDVFVVDHNNHRIQRFDRNLNFVSAITSDANLDARLQFAFPVAVAYSAFGEMFIAEQEHNRILKIDAGGKPVLSFGDYDWGAGSLQEPISLALSAKNELFVADVMRHAIIKFDYFGNFLQEIRHPDLRNPVALAVGQDALFCLDGRQRLLFAFSQTGELVTNLSIESGLKEGKAETANGTDIAIAGKSLYILDSVAAVIHCYHITFGSR